MSGLSVESMSMADGGTGLGFAHVAVSAVSTEHTGLDFIQVIAPDVQLGLQQVDIRLITAFLHRHTQSGYEWMLDKQEINSETQDCRHYIVSKSLQRATDLISKVVFFDAVLL